MQRIHSSLRGPRTRRGKKKRNFMMNDDFDGLASFTSFFFQIGNTFILFPSNNNTFEKKMLVVFHKGNRINFDNIHFKIPRICLSITKNL